MKVCSSLSSRLSCTISHTSITGPLFPRPSRQLLECLGWLQIKRTPRPTCFHHATTLRKRPRALEHREPKKRLYPEALSSLDRVLEDTRQLLETDIVPKEIQILDTLKKCKELAEYLRDNERIGSSSSGSRGSSNVPKGSTGQSLFILEENDGSARGSESKVAAAIQAQAIQRLSDAVYDVVKDAKVFITAPVLEAYIEIQSLLGRPESFAEVFNLYANKLVPVENSSPIRFLPSKPSNPSSAVPPGIANAALDAAIEAKILPLCLDIINSTVCAPAFKRNKIIRKALVPVLGAAAVPVAAWGVAKELAMLQITLSNEMATKMAFAGILSYVAFTGTIGFVALTTANDQMDRVTWADGMPLRQRWLREEERAMLDKVAGSWGFSDPRRKGEEEGPEWEALKELVGIRGMILDRVNLMEGME